MENSSDTDKCVSELGSKLNINAPVFEPKKFAEKNELINNKVNAKGNIKSTMLVPPQMQQNICPLIYSNPMQYQMKIDYNGSHFDNPCALLNLPTSCIVPLPGTNNYSSSISPQKPLNKNDNARTVENNGVTGYSNFINNDQYMQPLSHNNLVPSISSGNMPLIISQNNKNPMVWHGCNQSPQVALMTPYYQHLSNVYVLRPPIYNTLAPISVLQDKLNLKNNIRDKVFKTGDSETDNILNTIVKTINPIEEFVFPSKNCRFFVIKSFSEDNIYQAIRHQVWCSTPSGNDTLITAYRQAKSKQISDDKSTEAHIFLLFSVNGSGYFCGVAEMISELNTQNSVNIWNQKKWQSQFSIRWLYIKDVPNSYLRHIKLESNDNRPVTNCRDATEIVPLQKGIDVLRIIHDLDYDTCLLNDFSHDSVKIDKG